MAQQTAVEWLMQNIEKSLPNFIEAWREEFEQAKQMEKEQIIKAATIPREQRRYNALKYNNNGEQYYNETFGNK